MKTYQFLHSATLNESLNTINKGNGNKVSSAGIIVFHEVGVLNCLSIG
jgi:hypothetical protein